MERELKKSIIVYSGGELGKSYPLTKIVDENGKKYTVFHNKKDGNVSKAYEQLGALNLGQKVGVAFNSEMKKFTNKEGKEVEYESRVVAYFADVAQDKPEVPTKPEFDFNAPTGNSETQTAPLPVEDTSGDIRVEDLPF